MLNAKNFESFDWNALKEGKVEEFLVGQEFIVVKLAFSLVYFTSTNVC